MKNIGLMIRNMVQYEQDQKVILSADEVLIDNIFHVMYERLEKESDDVLKATAVEIVQYLKDNGMLKLPTGNEPLQKRLITLLKYIHSVDLLSDIFNHFPISIRRFFAISKQFISISIPINFLFNFKQATPVLPAPINGSSTISFSLLEFSI